MVSPAKRESSAEKAQLLRKLPSVDELLLHPGIAALCQQVNRDLVADAVREVLADLREQVLSGDSVSPGFFSGEVIEQQVSELVQSWLAPSLQPVINASGVILHTNLGRAPLSQPVLEQLTHTATQYSNLEYDLSIGARGKRDVHTSRLIERLTGAKAAAVVNNCAAAVLVTLAALARGGEVIVSRGELIEIGDGFRIPEIMEQSGAFLREVGTTNRTRISDYETAINEKTRILLRVHRSNFTITGFTEKPPVADLIALGERAGIPVVEDLGSGCILDLSGSGVREPAVRESIDAGFSLVLFSGDKLLGGPQAGFIAGKKELVAQVRRHPLFRVLRVDKLTITALESTLHSYLRGAWSEIPALRMIRMTSEEIGARAHMLRGQLQALNGSHADVEITSGESLVGGGSTPEQSLPSKLLRIASTKYSATQLEQRLRRPASGVPVIARIENDRLIVDLRTVFAEQESALVQALTLALR